MATLGQQLFRPLVMFMLIALGLFSATICLQRVERNRLTSSHCPVHCESWLHTVVRSSSQTQSGPTQPQLPKQSESVVQVSPEKHFFPDVLEQPVIR